MAIKYRLRERVGRIEAYGAVAEEVYVDGVSGGAGGETALQARK